MMGNGAPLLLLAAALLAGCGAPAGTTARPEPAPPPLLEVPTSPANQRRAAQLLEEGRVALEQGDAAEARALAETVVERYPGAQASSGALLLLARATAALGETDAALESARRYVDLFPPDAAAAAEGRALVVELEERARIAAERARARVILGAVLPRSGNPALERYAELVLEGVRLALEEFMAEEGREAELVLLDDAGDPARAGELVRELEAAGAVGAIGPLLSASLETAAAQRGSAGFPLVSPTASELPPGPGLYTLNATGISGAQALAAYAARSGIRSAATLYPLTMDSRRQAEAFAEAARAVGMQVVAEVPYDSGATSFAAVIRRVRETAPEALFVPAPARDVRQLAPQLAFYWLQAAALQDTLGSDTAGADSILGEMPRGVREPEVLVLGGQAWASDEVLRTVAPRILEGVVAALPLYKPGEGHGWERFVERYENTYRRTLDNPYPGLGYDAARLLLEAAKRAETPTAEAISVTLRGIRDLPGATGILVVDGGLIERRPWLVRIQAGELVPLPRAPRRPMEDGR